jgi:hypothetical protein
MEESVDLTNAGVAWRRDPHCVRGSRTYKPNSRILRTFLTHSLRTGDSGFHLQASTFNVQRPTIMSASNDYFTSLPTELIAQIIAYVHPSYLKGVSSVNWRLREICLPRFWSVREPSPSCLRSPGRQQLNRNL